MEKSLRGIISSAAASTAIFKNKYGDIFSKGELQDTCGDSCKEDGDCQPGGFVTCGKCGQYAGTQYYHVCYNDNEKPTRKPTRKVSNALSLLSLIDN